METALPQPTQDERSMAMLAHLLQLFTGFLGPLIIYFLRRQSPFVRFHSLQALFWQLLLGAFFLVATLVILFTVAAAATGGQTGSGRMPPAFLIALGLFWLGTFAVSILNLVVVIYFTVKSSKGEWTRILLVGEWARRAAGVPSFSR